jgi:hypothetical protein
MIELMTVVAIIAILSGLLVIGIGKLQASAKRQQTASTMVNTGAMFADYQNTLHTSYRSAGTMDCPQNVTQDYFKSLDNSSMDPTTAMPPSDRYGNAVLLTRDMFYLMRALPANAAAFGKMSAEETMAVPGPKSVNTMSGSYSYFMPVAPDYTAIAHKVGERVKIANPTLAGSYTTYACVRDVDATHSQSPPLEGYWVLEPDKTIQVTMILDAWGNPIIFVPSSLGSSPPSATGILVTGGVRFAQVAPDNRSFFASAGPDGNFATGDDNIYSFEK